MLCAAEGHSTNKGLQGLQIKMIITIIIVSDQYRNTKDKKNKIKLKNDTNGPIR